MILLKFGKEIKGDSTVEGFKDYIDISSLQFGVGRAITASGSGKDRDTSVPQFSEVTISKSTDVASAELFAQSISGISLTSAEFVFIQTAGDKLQVLLKVELGDPIVSAFSISSGGDRPSESISLNFTKIVFTYNPFDSNTAAQGKPKGWDLATNKGIVKL